MLTVERKEKIIEVKIQAPVPKAGTWTFHFHHTSSSEVEAAFVVDAIDRYFHDHLELQRETWYEKGWHDKLRHFTKRSWFPNTWHG